MVRVLKAFINSCQGLKAAVCHETAFRDELIVFACMLPIVYWVTPSWGERALLLAVWLLVMIVELLNSGLELTCDAITLEKRDWIKKVKDYGSAAVTLSIVLAVLVWAALLMPRVI